MTAGIETLLEKAREGLLRLDPHETQAAVLNGALLIDTRTDPQRAEQGDLPGAIVIDRTVMEWRLDPTSPHRIPEATDHDVQIIVVCRQGYSSSLAAASLQALGLWRATDLIGGFEAWQAAGLPLSDKPADVRY
ncbi:rhodanese-like domain-containing protein [Paractinoplanes atraurantiacus]|uniref:Rhodanese-related sulfurtransferase n=1 Tax=Paractinoplanes atraurantiacus TaxID=1036182 RepID=A0A285GIQ1_9ACTN|nr:rhodanese-like domain-containing protein [Actinoplanes atraurantiacus]SNY23472.1 Rhodanese-related sulfurtransferase [Actinoplanes atraurantiacus]